METISFSSRLHLLNAGPAAPTPGEEQDLVSMNRQVESLEFPHICMGAALMRTPLFQGNELRLFCGVPVRYLLPEGAPSWNEFFDFVVCQGQDAVMTVKLANMDQQVFNQLLERFRSAFPPEFVQLFQGASLYEDWVANDVIAPTIAQTFQPDGFRVKSVLLPVPSKLLKKLAEPSMQALTKETVGGRKYWVPTEYGRSLGLLLGFRTDQYNRVRSMICCAQDAIDGLRETVSWGEPDGPPPVPRPGPLAQRIDLAKKGISTQTNVMMDLVRQLAEMPLENYFRDDPNGLAEFQRVFPDARTYQEAANSLENSEDNSELLEIFAGPLINRTDIPLADKRVRGVLLGASLLARSRYLIWNGELLFHDHDRHGIAGNWSYRKWLQWAIQTIHGSPRNVNDLYRVIYCLIVQPFFLVYQQTAKHCA